ncbi:hypothetical protein D3C75_1056020 [compost metagenome]
MALANISRVIRLRTDRPLRVWQPRSFMRSRPLSAAVACAHSVPARRTVSLVRYSNWAPAVSISSNWLLKNSMRRRTSCGTSTARISCSSWSPSASLKMMSRGTTSSGRMSCSMRSSISSRNRGLNASACTTTSMRSRRASIT